MTKYRIYCYHYSMLGKMHPHQDEFIVYAEDSEEASRLFHEEHPEYYVDHKEEVCS